MTNLYDSMIEDEKKRNSPITLHRDGRTATLGELIDGCRVVDVDDVKVMLTPGKPALWATEDGLRWFVRLTIQSPPRPGTRLWVACVEADRLSLPYKVELTPYGKPRNAIK